MQQKKIIHLYFFKLQKGIQKSAQLNKYQTQYQIIYFSTFSKERLIKDLIIGLYSQRKRLMKKEEPADIKLLHKKYKFFDKPNIAILYDFCEEDYEKTEKILIMSKEVKNPKTIIKLLLEKPERGQALISSMEKRYDDEEKIKKQAERKLGNQAEAAIEGGLDFFRYVPQDACLWIYLFLDPYSAIQLSICLKKLKRVYQSAAFSEYYKRLCINLFEKFQPSLPQPSRFLQVKDYVLKNAHTLGPNAQHAVLHNLRKYVWGENVVIQKQPTSYYQSFGGYKELYFKAPRINFNGYYFWKHQYRKEEEKDLLKNAGNVHVVKYYRYLRFFSDGSVISVVLPSKNKRQVLLPFLSVRNFQISIADQQKWKDLMIGQYIVKRDQVEVKVAKFGSIFSYSLKIMPGSKSELMVMSYQLKVIDSNEIIQTLVEHNAERPIFFSYFPCSALASENSDLIRSSGL